MAITFTLVERTPYCLRYLAASDDSEPPVPEPGLTADANLQAHGIDIGVIPNADGPSPDLRGDAGGWTGQPIDRLVNTPVDSVAAARRLFIGDGLTGPDALDNRRGTIVIIPRGPGAPREWTVDVLDGASAKEIASTGFGVLVVAGPGGGEAYIELRCRHSFDDI